MVDLTTATSSHGMTSNKHFSTEFPSYGTHELTDARPNHMPNNMARIVWSVVGIATVVGSQFLLHKLIRPDALSRGPTNADISALAKDAHVLVGDVPLVLPFVALSDQVSMGNFFSLDRHVARKEWKRRREDFQAAALNPSNAPVLNRIRLNIDTYGWNDFNWEPWRKICDQLTRKWSRAICDDPWAPLQQALPRATVYLTDDRHFDDFAGHSTIGQEIVADQLGAMSLKMGVAAVMCDHLVSSSGNRFCTAAVPIAKHLVAVWTVFDSEVESAAHQAEREGLALAVFVKNALGLQEDFDALLAVVCETRRPGSEPSGIPSTPPDPCLK